MFSHIDELFSNLLLEEVLLIDHVQNRVALLCCDLFENSCVKSEAESFTHSIFADVNAFLRGISSGYRSGLGLFGWLGLWPENSRRPRKRNLGLLLILILTLVCVFFQTGLFIYLVSALSFDFCHKFFANHLRVDTVPIKQEMLGNFRVIALTIKLRCIPDLYLAACFGESRLGFGKSA